MVISQAAVAWINENWRNFHGPRPLSKELKAQAKARGWKIPSESWVYRQWRKMPEISRTYYLKGRQAYESKLAPYVPRDFSDLQALQVLAALVQKS